MCLVSGHDSPRSLTSIYNPGLYKYRTNPRADRQYRVDRPDATAQKKLRMILLSQFTSIGAPHIYYGDEVGMWGADDPDNRKPMVWGDLTHDNEKTDPFARPRSNDDVRPDLRLWEDYRRLIRLRREYADCFVNGDHQWVEASDSSQWLVVSRGGKNRRAFVIYNLGKRQGSYRLQGVSAAFDPLSGARLEAPVGDRYLDVSVEGQSGRVLIGPAS